MTLNEARELFFTYKCSKFSMARENLEVYESYLKLKIEKDIENGWREEKLIIDYIKLSNKPNQDNSWMVFSDMYNLVEVLKSSESLNIMKKSYQSIKNYLQEKDRIVIAETIIGRKSLSSRSGLIFISYDIGEKEDSLIFSQFVLELLNTDFKDASLQKRAEAILKNYSIIIEDLDL